MASRLSLQATLESILGTRNVYFDPPESIKMKYPCIVYELSKLDSKFANNRRYKDHVSYKLTYIDNDPDSTKPKEIMALPYTAFDRHYAQSDLHHTVINIYY